MRYVIAFVGAVFIFAAAFILVVVLINSFAPGLAIPVNLGLVETNQPIAYAVASLAAISSFAATIKRRKRDRPDILTQPDPRVDG